MMESALGDDPFTRKNPDFGASVQTLKGQQPRMAASASEVGSTEEHLEVVQQQESMSSSDLLHSGGFSVAALGGSSKTKRKRVDPLLPTGVPTLSVPAS